MGVIGPMRYRIVYYSVHEKEANLLFDPSSSSLYELLHPSSFFYSSSLLPHLTPSHHLSPSRVSHIHSISYGNSWSSFKTIDEHLWIICFDVEYEHSAPFLLLLNFLILHLFHVLLPHKFHWISWVLTTTIFWLNKVESERHTITRPSRWKWEMKGPIIRQLLQEIDFDFPKATMIEPKKM